MDTLTIEQTYGQALFDAASDRGRVDEIGEEYEAVRRIFADEPLLRRLLFVPTLSVVQKKDVVKNVFGGRVSQELLNFLCILIDKRRMDSLDGIGKHYEKLIWKRDGLTKGILYSVMPIGADRLSAIEERVGAGLGKKVVLENRLDKSIIGGVKIYIDGKLIDANVKARLESMKQRIKS